eukprot:CCRYP_012587-RA/>CCRYP_012587-RA protein AED:0.05 eAED:0.05 QI:399/1/1/1/0/0/2/81/345
MSHWDVVTPTTKSKYKRQRFIKLPSDSFICGLAFTCIAFYQTRNATSLQSGPYPSQFSVSKTFEQIGSSDQRHPSGRRWKRRRKQQKFLPAPHKNISPSEEEALVKQLGYLPPNICRVSARSGICSSLDQYFADNDDTFIDTSSCGVGRPIAIQSYPLLVQQTVHMETNVPDTTANMYENCNVTPIPTLYWLCDPHVSRAISELERQGCVRNFQARLENEPSRAKEWLECHEQYALERWNLLSNQDKTWLLNAMVSDEKESRTIESMRDMIQNSGVAGTDYKGQKQQLDISPSMFVPSVKCLHSHYAHYRSQLCSESGTTFSSKLNVIGVWTHELLTEKFPEIIL